MPRKKKSDTETKPSPKPKRVTAAKSAVKAKSLKKTAAPKVPKAAKAPSLKKTAPRTRSAKASPAGQSPNEKQIRKGETQMVAFIRDPRCIFTYWEVTPESVAEVQKQLMEEYKESSMVLRVFRTGPDGRTDLIQEIRVTPSEMNRYVELAEGNGVYYVEIAQKTVSGKTVVFARSNRIMTGTSVDAPSHGASASSGPQWEAPSGIMEYFSEVEEAGMVEPILGISSAERYRQGLLRKKMDRYSASRIQ